MDSENIENAQSSQVISSSQQVPPTNSARPLFNELCRFFEIASKEKGDAKKHKLESFFRVS